MISNLEKYQSDTLVERSCNVCILGGGTAGLFLAQSLKDSGINVIVIELGGASTRDVDASFKTVFTSTDPNFEWNGNDLGGEPAKKGYYIAIITSKDKNGHEAKPVMYQFEIRK